MSELSNKQCEPCRIDSPQVTEEQARKLLAEIHNWEFIKLDGMNRLRKTYTFQNFVEAVSFTNKVAEISEEEGHHPAILTEWGKVTVEWWTHKIKGVHANDFVMAAKTDKLIE
jgi:4a-hydroxytetrahydrobiopterin dehydratase